MHIYTKQNLYRNITHKELTISAYGRRKINVSLTDIDARTRDMTNCRPFLNLEMTPTEADYLGRKLIYMAEKLRLDGRSKKEKREQNMTPEEKFLENIFGTNSGD